MDLILEEMMMGVDQKLLCLSNHGVRISIHTPWSNWKDS